jgi:hypothetical protein
MTGGLFNSSKFAPLPIRPSDPWHRRAHASLVNFFCRQERERPFLLEQVIAEIGEECGEPRNGQAWGPVIKRAESDGVVAQAGFRLAANGRPATLWKRGSST